MSLNLGTMFAAVALDSSNFRNGLSALLRLKIKMAA